MFFLSEEDRASHIYVIGATGVGKSKALANWVYDDIVNEQRGCAVIDPHGDLILDIIPHLDDEDANRVVLIDFTDPNYVVGFNPLEVQEGIDSYTQTLELVEVFRKIWDLDDATAPRLLEILRNSIFTLMEIGGTMLDIEPLLTNKEFRDKAIMNVKNEAVVSFWQNRFDRWKASDQISFVESTLNKVSSFTFEPRIRMMLSAKKSTVNFREIMDNEQAVLVNLAKGALRTNSYLLGALFVAKIQMAAMSRQNIPKEQRKPFYLYVDEFQDYTTFSFAEILSEARKYGLSLTLAHQNLCQLDEKLRNIILANAKNFVCFRMDRQDADLLVKYLKQYDPFMLKMRQSEKVTYYDMREQQELGVINLISTSTQYAILKTKGMNPVFFRVRKHNTLKNPIVYCNDFSKLNYETGYLLSMSDLEKKLTFQAASIYEHDEPEDFKE